MYICDNDVDDKDKDNDDVDDNIVCYDLEPITRGNPQAVGVRIFMLDSERQQLKKACDRNGTNMSHLARKLLLEWLAEQE